MDSPLHAVTVAVTGPQTATPGSRIVYHVVLANPTGQPVPLEPCPGYTVELFSMGDASHEAVNHGQLYRMNCRPVHALPAGGSVRFEMVAEVPASMSAGRDLTVTWRLAAPRFAPGAKHWGTFTLRTA
jgi:hypothetical protein